MILKNVQVLRGIAALLVCLFHLAYLMNNHVVDFFSRSGFLGVDIFFVISGIIMVLTTKKLEGRFLYKAKAFLTKRAIRIIPLYYITTVVWILVTHRVSYYFGAHLPDLIGALCFVPVPVFTDDSPFPYPALYVGWSLNYEILFYLIFAASFLFKRGQFYFIYFILGCLVFIVPLFEGSIAAHLSGFGSIGALLTFIKNPILLFFLAGVLIGNLLPYIRLKKNLTLIFLGIATGFFLLFYFHVIPDIFAIRLLASTMLVFSIVLCDQYSFKIPTPDFLLYLGNISYSIYLIHPIVLACLPAVMKKLDVHLPVSSFSFFIVFFTILLVSSALSYEIVEKRFTLLLRKRLVQRAALISVLDKVYRFPSVALQKMSGRS